MLIIYIMLLNYLVLNFFIYNKISNFYKSWFNSYTIYLANSIFIKLVPFIVCLKFYSYYKESIQLFVLILYISSIMQYMGYRLGHKIKIISINNFKDSISIQKLKFFEIGVIIIGILSFVLLGSRGVGITNWIIHTRNAYLRGRTGLGIYYTLFQLTIILSCVITLFKAKKSNQKPYKYLLFLFFAYFTGSKRFLLGIGLLYVFYYDWNVKKIKLEKVTLIASIAFFAIIILLSKQSSISLIKYSDYYINFIRYLHYNSINGNNFYHGQILFEDIFWKLIPRSMCSEKPFIYGTSRIIKIFYGETIILKGNTPSFSEFIYTFADFGLMGITIFYFIKGFCVGIIEHYCKYYSKSIITFIFYTLLFVVSPSTFSLLYTMVLLLILLLYKNIKIKTAI